MHGVHRTEAGDAEGELVLMEHIVDSPAELFTVSRQGDRGVGGEQLRQHDAAGRHRRDVVVERAGVGDRVGLRRVEAVEQFGSSGERAEREPPGEVLAEGGDVGTYPE